MTRSDDVPALAFRLMPSRLSRPPVLVASVLLVLVAAVGTFGVLRAADDSTEEVEYVDDVQEVLATNDGPAENYLLVGSDTRENVAGSGLNEDATGSAEEVGGQRSDTIMILRRQKDGGAYLLSLPRDLWVDIPGYGHSRINSAYAQGGARLLSETIRNELGIPIHHYVEVDFVGFTKIVDAMGGVDICVGQYEVRDKHSGLSLMPGCTHVDGPMALAYARSRHYEEFRDGRWREDPSADLGRIHRQQQFILDTAQAMLGQIGGNPLLAGDLIREVAPALRVDQGTDPVEAAQTLRAAATAGLHAVQLPVVGETINGNAVLELGDGAEPILDFFRGVSSEPPVAETTVAQ